MKKNRDRQPQNARRKISEMIWEFAGPFIRVGSTPEERQSRLNAACSAWNISCDPPERRRAVLDRYMAEYQRCNPRVGPADCTAIRSDMEKLIARKLELFPADRRQIVGARLVALGDKDRIEAVAATFR